MVTANRATVKKVIALGLLAFSVTFLKAEIPTSVPTKKTLWVDSVFSSLSRTQKIKLLYFQATEGSGIEIAEGIGGLWGLYQPAELGRDGLPLIRGLRFQDRMFDEILGIPGSLINCIEDLTLLSEVGREIANRLLNSGYHFLLSENKVPTRTDEQSRALLQSIDESGLSVWDCDNCRSNKHLLDAIAIEDFVEKQGYVINQLTKKDLRRLRKELQRENRLVYYIDQEGTQNTRPIDHLADVTIFRRDFESHVERFSDLLTTRKIKKSDFETRVKKVLKLKYKIHKNEKDPRPHEKDKILKRKLWENGIVLANDEQQLIPIKRLDDRSFASLSLGPFEEGLFQKSLDHYTFFTHYGEADFINDKDRLKTVLGYYDYVIAGFSFPDLASRENEDIAKRVEFLRGLSQHTQVVIVVFGSEKWIDSFDVSPTVFFAHSNAPDPLGIVPQIIFGALPSQGILHINNGSLERGIRTESIERLRYSFAENEGFDSLMVRKIDLLIKSAIESEATPGCQILVARNGDVVLEKAYGFYTYDNIQPVSTETIYDLASITKVMGTLQATMFLESRGAMDLDQKASSYLPELKETNKENLVIRRILTHQAGLLPYFPFYKKTLSGDRLNPDYYKYYEGEKFNQAVAPGIYGNQALDDSVWSWAIQSSMLKLEEGQKDYGYNYSDLGFMMMKKLNEKLLNQPMEEFLDQNIYSPLGMASTCYQPLCKFALHGIAPTEVDYNFRNSLVWGLVHDENAALTGGIGGHAGLFSNANDLAILLQMNMQDGNYGGNRFFPSGTVSRFAEKQFFENRRGLGWDKPEFLHGSGNTSKYSSKSTFGHLGFTGTAIWVDPEYDLIYVFLSNRVHPDRENTKLMMDNIRSKIHDIIYESMPEFRHDS